MKSFNFKVKQVVLITGLALTLSANQAHAVYASNLPAAQAAIEGKIASMQATIAGAISAMSASLSALITQAVAQIHADLTQQNVFQKSLAESTIDANHQYDLQVAKARITEQYHSGGTASDLAAITAACQVALGGSAMGTAAADVRDMASVTTDIALARTMNTTSQSAVIAKDLKQHGSLFCGEQDAARGRCALAPVSQRNADLKAGTLFKPNDTQTYTPNDKIAATAFITGVVNPFPSAAVPKEWDNTPQGKSLQAAQMVEQRRLSLADQVLAEISASREPQGGLGTSLGLTQTPDISFAGLMEHFAGSGFFLNQKWHTDLSTKSQNDLLKEQTKLAAFQNWMEFKSFQQGEHIEALLATQLAIQVKQASEPMLAAQRNAAAVAGSK